MTSRERAKLIDHLNRLADEALKRGADYFHARRSPAVIAKERGRAEAFRVAADLIEQGEFYDDV